MGSATAEVRNLRIELSSMKEFPSASTPRRLNRSPNISLNSSLSALCLVVVRLQPRPEFIGSAEEPRKALPSIH